MNHICQISLPIKPNEAENVTLCFKPLVDFIPLLSRKSKKNAATYEIELNNGSHLYAQTLTANLNLSKYFK